jgi:hypothetical protein
MGRHSAPFLASQHWPTPDETPLYEPLSDQSVSFDNFDRPLSGSYFPLPRYAPPGEQPAPAETQRRLAPISLSAAVVVVLLLTVGVIIGSKSYPPAGIALSPSFSVAPVIVTAPTYATAATGSAPILTMPTAAATPAVVGAPDTVIAPPVATPTPKVTTPAAPRTTSAGRTATMTISIPSACYPLSITGRCYLPGQICRDSDHGDVGTAINGNPIMCVNVNGWRWEPVLE